MTTLLEKTIEKLQKLSSQEQDNLATLILQELEWEFRFQNTQNELSLLAAEALAEFKAGKTQNLDDLL